MKTCEVAKERPQCPGCGMPQDDGQRHIPGCLEAPADYVVIWEDMNGMQWPLEEVAKEEES